LGLAYRPVDPGLDLDRVLSFRYQRVVAKDNTVRLEGRLIQIPPGPKRRSYFKARVWVHEFIDGSLGVWYQDQWLTRSSARGDSPVVRARKRNPPPPERPAVLTMPLPLQPPEQEAKAREAPRQPAHPWRQWNPTYLAKTRERTESRSS
jgi:hypothetical protein